MKIRVNPIRARQGGNILMVAIVATGLMALVLFSYLQMVGNDNTLTARSQSWNACMAIAEAGAEEAMAHLNKNGTSMDVLIASEGWVLSNGLYCVRRQMGDGYYDVSIKAGVRPEIVSTGYVPAPTYVAFHSPSSGAFLAAAGKTKAGETVETIPSDTVKETVKGKLEDLPPWERGHPFLKRTIRVMARKIGRFTKAIVAKDSVDLNGKRVYVDSYHSYDPTASTYDGTNGWGVYDPAKRRDRADIAVVEGFKDDLDVNDAKVFGKLSTGPKGDVKQKKNAVVGSLKWHEDGNTGVEPGWSSNDANFDMPDVEVPFEKGAQAKGGTIGTNTYDYILGDGEYETAKLSGKVIVTGAAKLLVKNSIEFKHGADDDEGIDFAPGGSLELYMAGKETKLVGKKAKKSKPSFKREFNAGGNATNFFYYGLAKNVKVELVNIDEFVGIIYAPWAHVTLKAGSLKYYKFSASGTIQGLKVKVEKNANFHYDENIGNLPADRYVVESWTEI